MNRLQINVEGWPKELVDTLRSYAEQVSTKLQENGEAPRLPKAPRDLPKWPGIASVPPEKLRREELYRDGRE